MENFVILGLAFACDGSVDYDHSEVYTGFTDYQSAAEALRAIWSREYEKVKTNEALDKGKSVLFQGADCGVIVWKSGEVLIYTINTAQTYSPTSTEN